MVRNTGQWVVLNMVVIVIIKDMVLRLVILRNLDTRRDLVTHRDLGTHKCLEVTNHLKDIKETLVMEVVLATKHRQEVLVTQVPHLLATQLPQVTPVTRQHKVTQRLEQ
jgi:hypothetical protein